MWQTNYGHSFSTPPSLPNKFWFCLEFRASNFGFIHNTLTLFLGYF